MIEHASMGKRPMLGIVRATAASQSKWLAWQELPTT
jgi:hypothetical protein